MTCEECGRPVLDGTGNFIDFGDEEIWFCSEACEAKALKRGTIRGHEFMRLAVSDADADLFASGDTCTGDELKLLKARQVKH